MLSFLGVVMLQEVESGECTMLSFLSVAAGSGEWRVYRTLLPGAAAGSREQRVYRALLARCGEAAGYR
jgi:hypothetical protein